MVENRMLAQPINPAKGLWQKHYLISFLMMFFLETGGSLSHSLFSAALLEGSCIDV